MNSFDFIVIGGGAAGFFAALSAKFHHPEAHVLIIEKTATLLSKVRISGGGRCNVTHACFDPKELVKFYPRGSKALIGPFCRFSPTDTMEWFETRNVALKVEADGRVFPKSDSSQSIINCLVKEAENLGVKIYTECRITALEKEEEGFTLHLKNAPSLKTANLLMATGSSSLGHKWAEGLGHTLKPTVPSLFTFNIPNSPLAELSGIAIDPAKVSIEKMNFQEEGPLLITHFGFSGPAILKLSAWAARELYDTGYHFDISIDWLPKQSRESLKQTLNHLKLTSPQKMLLSENPFLFPKKFWRLILSLCQIDISTRFNDLSKKSTESLIGFIKKAPFKVSGKTTHKEEFVSCGGIPLEEINFKTMESKITKGLYFAGEILDIDGITGGFNFQNAWTTGFIAGQNFSK